MNKMARAGLVILVVSIGILAGWKIWFNSRSWNLVDDVPISLAKGSHYSSPEVPVNLSQQYVIEIWVSNENAPETLRCQLGAGSRNKPCNPPSPFNVHWTLSSEGKVLQEGGASPELGELSTGPKVATRTIALFNLKKGHHYKVDIDVLSDSGDLNSANPRLYVGEFSTLLSFYLFVGSLLRLICFAVAALGALMLISGLLEWRPSRNVRRL
jgi:hypothetical protein